MTSRLTMRAFVAAAILAAASPLIAQTGPPATASHLPAEVLSLACAPRATHEPPAMPIRVTGGQDGFVRTAYHPGDLVSINAGKKNGIEVGQEYYVRRLQVNDQANVTHETPATIRTTGWVRVYGVDPIEELSLVTITHACDAIQPGDFLEPFALPTLPTVSKDRAKPQRGNYANVIGGDDRRTSFGTGDYIVVNRGSDHGYEKGSQFVIYHDKKVAQNFLFEVGEAVAVDVKSDVSTLQVVASIDAIHPGDLAALRREPPDEKK